MPVGTKSNQSPDARRERNRRAQHDFRMRRQAIAESNRHRILLLEDTVQDLSNLLVRTCDELLQAEEVAAVPRLMARLRSCMTEALRMAKSTLESEETRNTARHERADGKRPKLSKNEMEGASTESFPSQTPRQAAHAHYKTHQAFDDDACRSNMIHDRGIDNIVGPAVGRLQPGVDLAGRETFSFRLVEATLLRASSVLSGDLPVTVGEIKRIFGSEMAHRNRHQLWSQFQWLTGPGRDQLFRVAGIRQENQLPNIGQHYPAALPLSSLDFFSSQDDEDNVGHQFLTAVGIEEQLERLGAGNLDGPTVELRIGASQASGSDKWQFSASEILGSSPSGPVPSPATELVLQLNTSLLANYLINVATCQGKRPVYPLHEIARAIEASITLAQEVVL